VILNSFTDIYVYLFNAQILSFVIVDSVSNFLFNTKEKNQQNHQLAFLVSSRLLNKNKINNLFCLDYSHSIVAGGFPEIS